MGRILTLVFCIVLMIAVACFYGYAALKFQSAVQERIFSAMEGRAQ